MKNRARVAGHPIHPMLIPIPVAAFPISLLFDVVFLVSDNPFWYAMAFWVMVVGIIGALAAAVPGLIDYMTSVPAGVARSTARRHGIANGALVLLYIVNAIVRGSGPMFGPRVGLAITMSVIGVAGLMYSGWLGGELVYKHRVGIDEPTAAVPPEEEERRVA